MNKKSKLILLTVGVAMLLLAALAWLGMVMNKVDQASIVFSHVANFFKTEDLQFTGDLKTGQYTAEFTSTIKGEKSKSEVILKPGNLSGGSLKGQAVEINGEIYFRVDDVSTLLDSLPKDPLSRAIRANLEKVASAYKGRWIRLEKSDQNNVKNCLMTIRGYKVDLSDAETSFSKHRFFDMKNMSQEGSVKKYEVTINNELPAFLADATRASVQQFEACNIQGATLKIYFSEQTNQIVRLEAAKDDWELTLSGFTYENLPTIEAPKTSTPFSRLKKSLNNLFIL